jgi:hypothetical protein
MPKQTYFVDGDPNSKLELSWKPGFNGLKVAWKQFTIAYNGAIVGVEENGLATLFEGKDYLLPDGSKLNIKLKQELSPTLFLTRNGVPLAGSAGDPGQSINSGRLVLIILGVANIIYGLLLNTGQGDIFSVLYAISLLGCGLLVNRVPLLGLAIGFTLYLADSVLFFVLSSLNGGNPMLALFSRLFILYFLGRGLLAAWKTSKISKSPKPADV